MPELPSPLKRSQTNHGPQHEDAYFVRIIQSVSAFLLPIVFPTQVALRQGIRWAAGR